MDNKDQQVTMNYRIYLVGACSIWLGIASASPTDDAASAFHAGDLDKARTLVLNQFEGPARIYNLGMIAYAQRDYHAAQRYWSLAINGADQELARRCQVNSSLVAQQLSHQEKTIDQGVSIVKRFKGALQLIILILMATVCLVSLKTRSNRMKAWSLLIGLMLSLVLYRWYFFDSAAQGCIVSETVMRVGPHDYYQQLGKLSRGESVGIIVQRGAWTQVAAHGQQGWIESTTLVNR